MARAWSQKLCICLLNVSEASNLSKVEAIAKAALRVNDAVSSRLKSSVLNIFSDQDYNRSVLTITGHIDDIGASIVSACEEAYGLIDLSQHEGGHPRLGAVDLIPLHPLTEDVTLQECGQVAHEIAQRLSDKVPGSSFFLFGGADPNQRGLVQRRKEVSWFKGCHGSGYADIQSDVGASPGAQRGLTGAGAIPYVMNCNVTIDTTRLHLGRRIAAALRATSPGGLPGVQAMAFPHQGRVEIACNVQGVVLEDSERVHPSLSLSFGCCYHVPADVIEGRVESMAREESVGTVGTSLVGFSPSEARRVATLALEQRQAEFWKTRNEYTM